MCDTTRGNLLLYPFDGGGDRVWRHKGGGRWCRGNGGWEGRRGMEAIDLINRNQSQFPVTHFWRQSSKHQISLVIGEWRGSISRLRGPEFRRGREARRDERFANGADEIEWGMRGWAESCGRREDKRKEGKSWSIYFVVFPPLSIGIQTRKEENF